MEIEIKVKGDLHEDRDEMISFAHSGELVGIIWNARHEIVKRQKFEDLSDQEDEFLDNLKEMLYVDWLM